MELKDLDGATRSAAIMTLAENPFNGIESIGFEAFADVAGD